ncbi:MAG: hypothetical protein AB8B47_15450 [Roseobacter sp.]
MSTIEISTNEQGVIRVFAVNRAVADMADALKTRPKADLARDLLNAPHLDTTTVEVFPTSDLAGVGLAGYLTEGQGVPSEQTEPDKPKLDALDGYVLLLFSKSFNGQDMTLSTGPEVTLIGTYTQDSTDWSAPVDLSTPSAQPYSGAAPQKKRPSDAAMSGRIAMLALLVAFFVVGLMVWVGS